MKDCLDICIPFVEAAAAERLPIQLYGGLATAATSKRDTGYCPDDRELVTAKRLELSRLRDNGSPRDLDVQVLSTDLAVVAQVEEVAQDTVGDQLDVNVFGLHRFSEIEAMRHRPFGKLAATAALADRYVVGDLTGSDSDSYFKAVFPFGVPAQQSTLETWHLVSRGKSEVPIPVPHPAMMILNNLTRSTAGMRKKYEERTTIMTDNLLIHNPELVDWMIDGPGKSHLELAGVLHSLGWLGMIRRVQPIQLSQMKNLRVPSPPAHTLIDHAAFLMADAPKDLQRQVMALARVRSAIVVGTVERHLQDQWERLNLERHFRNIVRNQ